jgi:protein phosphatase
MDCKLDLLREVSVIEAGNPMTWVGDEGPFDIIGDVHGCADELADLLNLLGYIE